MNLQDDLKLMLTWPVRYMVELKTRSKLLAASASSTIDSPNFNDLSRSIFLKVVVKCPEAEIQSDSSFIHSFNENLFSAPSRNLPSHD